MCGRYVKEITDHVLNYHEYLHDFIDASRAANATSQYNVAPSTMQDLRCDYGGGLIVQPGKWGLVPHWSKDGKGYQINARAETCHEKPMFKKSFQQRRCVTWASGYYEWQATSSGKQPYYIHFHDHRPFFFYGLWQSWNDPKTEESKATFATLTTEPAEHLAFIHDRMPCIVEVDHTDVDLWLNHQDDDFEARHDLLRPYESHDLVATPVSTYVNSVRNQGPKCIEPM